MASFYSYITILIIVYSIALIGLIFLPYFHEQHHDDNAHYRSTVYRLLYHGDGVFTYERHADLNRPHDVPSAMAPANRLRVSPAADEAARLILSSEGVDPFRARNNLRDAAWEGGTEDIIASSGEPDELDID